MIKLTQTQDGNRGKFYYKENSVELAKITYEIQEQKFMAIDHTIVDKSLGGQGVGKLLAETALQFAKENNYKVIPVCPFIESYINKNPEWIEIKK